MYYFIINPNSRSGRGKTIWHRVKAHLDELQIPYRFYFTRYKFHATKLASHLCQQIEGPIQLVVLGGDGTINEVINGITDFTKVCLSYIPSGSSNDFARSLGISSNPQEALATVLAPAKQTIVDIGEMEVIGSDGDVLSRRKFAVSTGIGFDAAICYEALNSKLKDVLNMLGLGKLTYGLIAAKQVICYKPTPGELIIDGKTKKDYSDILFLVSMVHKYEGGGAILAPQAVYNDKKLSVCFVHNLNRWKVLFLLPTAFIAKHTLFKGVDVFDCSTIELIQKDARVSHADGEFSGNNRHIRVCCNKETLTVNTPG